MANDEVAFNGFALIADDDPVDRAPVKALLEGQGWFVGEAQDGMQAVMMARANPPDVLILDVLMPGGTGIIALKRLRSMPEGASIPVLVVSGRPRHDFEDEISGLEIMDWLVKPVSAERFLESLSGVSRQPLSQPLSLHGTNPLPEADAESDRLRHGLGSEATQRLVRKLVTGR